MRRALTTVEPIYLDFNNFAGGLNFLQSPENIADNELAECVNMTYSSSPGKLRTRAGIGDALATYTSNVTGLVWYKNGLYASTSDKQFWHVWLNGEATPALVGTLTGSFRPQFCEYGGELFIATHGQLQKFDGTTLTTITDAPNADVVYARAGRVFCSYSGSDTLHGSAVGDGETWTIPLSPTDSDPVEINIGYKVAGNIYAILPALTDVIIFKTDGIFRLIGEYPDWSIKEVARDERICNRHCVVDVAGYVFYLERSKGLRLLQGTQGYEEIAPADTVQKVNPWIREHVSRDYAALWHLPARNIILVSTDHTQKGPLLPCYYEFGVQQMPVLKWEFRQAVRAVCEPDRSRLYIALGKSVYDFSGVSAYDPDPDDGDALKLVPCGFSTKVYRGFSHYVVKRMTIRAESLEKQVLTTVPCRILVNETPYMSLIFNEDVSPLIYGNGSQVYLNDGDLTLTFFDYVDFSKHNLCRQKSVQFHYSNEGAPFELTRFAVEMYPVGVTA